MSILTASSIETLEDRIAPAGVVKVTVSGGNVTVSGDANNNDILLMASPDGTLSIQGNGSTQIQVGAAAPGASASVLYTKNLTVALGAGADRVELGAGGYFANVMLDGGADNNTFVVDAVVVPGALKIIGKAGADTLTLNPAGADLQVGRDFSISLGDGANTSGTGVTPGRIVVGGKLLIAGGKGSDLFNWETTNFVVSGDVAINTGKSFDSVSVHATDSIGLNGKLTATGGSAPLFSAGATASNFSFRADDELVVRRAVSINPTTSDSTVAIGGTNSTTLAGGLAVKGAGFAELVGGFQNVLGNLSIVASGFTQFTMTPATGFFVGGSFTFKGGAGVDSVNVTGDGTITGKASIDLGVGAAQSAIFTGKSTGGIAVFGDLAVAQGEKTGISATTIRSVLVGGKFGVKGAGAADTINIDNTIVGGTTSIATGDGADVLKVEVGNIGGVNFGASSFFGAVKIALGGGGDSVAIGSVALNDSASFTTGGVIDGGAGVNILTIELGTIGASKFRTTGFVL